MIIFKHRYINKALAALNALERGWHADCYMSNFRHVHYLELDAEKLTNGKLKPHFCYFRDNGLHRVPATFRVKLVIRDGEIYAQECGSWMYENDFELFCQLCGREKANEFPLGEFIDMTEKLVFRFAKLLDDSGMEMTMRDNSFFFRYTPELGPKHELWIDKYVSAMDIEAMVADSEEQTAELADYFDYAYRGMACAYLECMRHSYELTELVDERHSCIPTLDCFTDCKDYFMKELERNEAELRAKHIEQTESPRAQMFKRAVDTMTAYVNKLEVS